MSEMQHTDTPDKTLRLLEGVAAFNYVTVPSAPTYRALMQVFFEAKQRYVIEMRPAAVLAALRAAGFHTEIDTVADLDYPLGQLVEWGNLSRSHDTAAVGRIEDFYRKRYLFRLTAVGEAAHRAVLAVEATVGRSGSLQTQMLVKIRDALQGLAQQARQADIEGGRVVRLLHDLFSAFESLTEEANHFIGELNRHIEGTWSKAAEKDAAAKKNTAGADGKAPDESAVGEDDRAALADESAVGEDDRAALADESAVGEDDRAALADERTARTGESENEQRFALYKQAVLAYIGRFVEQLRKLSGQIRAFIESVDRPALERLLGCAVSAADLPPPVRGKDPAAQWSDAQRVRWQGVCAWFVGVSDQQVATVERLASVAVGAVVGLTRALSRLNDQRIQPVDRTADFLTLARWFAACADEKAAERLFGASFGLYPALHFHLAAEDAERTAPVCSWWEAEPVRVAARLRTHGRLNRSGRPAPVADHTMEKRWIAQRWKKRRRQRLAAERRFVDQGPLRLSTLGRLTSGELDFLLDLLDDVLSHGRPVKDTLQSRTADGRLAVTLRRPLLAQKQGGGSGGSGGDSGSGGSGGSGDSGDSDGATESRPGAFAKGAFATLLTARGRLFCRDYEISVRRLSAAAATRRKALG
jgi:hypothetical protein